MQTAVIVVACAGRRGPAQFLQALQVAFEIRLVVRELCQQLAQCGGIPPARRRPVIHEMPVPETLQEPGVAQDFQLLRDARLALREDVGEFRNAAFAAQAKRGEAQPHRVRDGLQLRQALLRVRGHKNINKNLYK